MTARIAAIHVAGWSAVIAGSLEIILILIGVR